MNKIVRSCVRLGLLAALLLTLGCPESADLPPRNVAPENVVFLAAPSTDPTALPSPLDVQFTGFAIDSDGQVVYYLLDFGDGSPPSTDPNSNHTYSCATTCTFTATLTIRDEDGGGSIAMLSINLTSGAPPMDIDPPYEFDDDIVKLFAPCTGCHNSGTRAFDLTGSDPAALHARLLSGRINPDPVDPPNPPDPNTCASGTAVAETSAILALPSGSVPGPPPHTIGFVIWSTSDPSYVAMLDWICDGSPLNMNP